MTFWTEIHWYEGMFLRPHHLQAAQRRLETLVRAAQEAVMPFAWGFVELEIAEEPLENCVLRLDRCVLRLKDGTWAHVPDNTEVAPLNFEAALDAGGGAVEVYFGVPQMQEVRANAVSLQEPDRVDGTPRYEPHALTRRDENTGANPQTLYVRRMRGRLFAAGEDMTGFEVVRVCRLKRTDRPGAVPDVDELGAGPLLAVQADRGLSQLLTSLADQVEAKNEVLAREARETQMAFTDGLGANTEHLLKLHALNGARAALRALLQSPLVHPFDAFGALARVIGDVSVFGEDLVPGALPAYDHDRPAEALDRLRRRLLLLLDALRPLAYLSRQFVRKKDERGRDGLEVELDRQWIDENLDMYVGLQCDDRDVDELYKHIRNTFDLKLASPKRSPRIAGTAVSGLRLQIKSVPAGVLPRRTNLHYFRVDKTIGPDRTDYWQECEQERGIRMSLREGQMAALEQFRPTLYVCMKGSGR
ncbi:MAG: type VI secretion system baseplate subunit TssK [Phycisphaerales bacterium]|nr:type VI secretion system baseplate subunit TssK [Phycisphaerales bacterium]